MQFVLRIAGAISPKVKCFEILLCKDLVITERSLEFPFSIGQPGAILPNIIFGKQPTKLSGSTEKPYNVKPQPNFNIKMKQAGGNSVWLEMLNK